MDDSSACPVCGSALPAAAGGLCPRCLLADAAQPTAPRGSEPPALAEVAAAFPQFEIIELIGQGGMGTVWRARQPKLNRHVALKLLPASLAERDPAFAERFDREGQLLARLHHPNIVVVHDSGRAGSFFYLVMELVDGVNLRQAMRASRFTPAQALAIVPKICDALQYAHEEGVLHRDIKPENILLDAKGRVKLADFGIAKLIAQPEAVPVGAAPAAGDGSLTVGDATLGTPNYMAPEQLAQPGEVDHRADIYSLGVVFYELLTGELPLGKFAPPSERSGADPRLDAVVQQALEKERARRQQSVGEMRTQVEGITGAPPRRKPSGWLSGVACFFAWSSGILGTVAWLQPLGLSRKLVLLILVSALLGVLLGLLSRRTWLGKHALIIGALNLLIWVGGATYKFPSPKEVPRFPQSAHIEGPSSALALYNDDGLDYVFYYPGRFTTSSSGSQNVHSLSWMDEGSITLPNGRTFGFHRESVSSQMVRVNGRDYVLPAGRVFVLHDDGSVERLGLFPHLIIAIDPKALGELIAENPGTSERSSWVAKMPSVQLTKSADALQKLRNKEAELKGKADAEALRATREKAEMLDAELERGKAAWYKFELALTRHETTGLSPAEFASAQNELGKAEVRLRMVQAMAENVANGATFGEVMERLVPANDQGPWTWFDIDAGEEVAGVAPDKSDFAAIMPPGHPGLSTGDETGFGSVPLESDAWQSMAPAQLLEKLHEGTVDFLSGDEPWPRTYGFTTRGGSFGILQIIGESAAPRGLKIRWKSLQSPSIAEAGQARRARLEKQLLKLIGEHLAGSGPDDERVDYRGLSVDVRPGTGVAIIQIDEPKPRWNSPRRALWSGLKSGELVGSDEGGGVWVVTGQGDKLGALQFKVRLPAGELPSR